MREIKFRALHTNPQNKRKWMVYGDRVFHRYVGSGMDGVTIEGRDDSNKFTAWVVDDKTVGQYTGLKDKNGKEIYEGDIIRTQHSQSPAFNEPVTFEMGGFSAGIYSDIHGYCDCEVIGNIYENPDLLES